MTSILKAALGAGLFLLPVHAEAHMTSPVQAPILPVAGAHQPAESLSGVQLAASEDHAAMGMATHGPLTIEGAVARASIGRAPNSAVYMTITTSGAPDRLIAAASTAADKVEIHESRMDGDKMVMSRIEGVEIEPGSPAVLEPGGKHVMLLGLRAPLDDGGMLELTLTFEKGGDVTLSVPISKRVGGHKHH